MTNRREVFNFDNDITVYKDHLRPHHIKRYAVTGKHEPVEEEILLTILSEISKERPNFIDIGAAMGYYSILAKKTYPNMRVYAFEPHEGHRQYFRENITLNGLKLDDFVIKNEAITNKVGSALLVDQRYGSFVTPGRPFGISRVLRALMRRILSIPLSKKWISGNLRRKLTERAFSVKTTCLDDIIDELGSSVDLVKIDVQGAEANILKGAQNVLRNQQIHFWLIGTHSSSIHAECVHILSAAGYKILYEQLDVPDQPDGLIAAGLSDISLHWD
jgi:FkbM family methyltransferase